jgi:hypothetical protein
VTCACRQLAHRLSLRAAKDLPVEPYRLSSRRKQASRAGGNPSKTGSKRTAGGLPQGGTCVSQPTSSRRVGVQDGIDAGASRPAKTSRTSAKASGMGSQVWSEQGGQ